MIEPNAIVPAGTTVFSNGKEGDEALSLTFRPDSSTTRGIEKKHVVLEIQVANREIAKMLMTWCQDGTIVGRKYDPDYKDGTVVQVYKPVKHPQFIQSSLVRTINFLEKEGLDAAFCTEVRSKLETAVASALATLGINDVQQEMFR